MFLQRLATSTALVTTLIIINYSTAHAEIALESGEVVVSATKTAKALKDAPVSIAVVTEKEAARKGSGSIGEMLQDIPGVEIVDGGAGGLKRVQIRGENSFRVLLMVDGQKITEQKSMSGVPFLVDPSTVERIEVIKGPASVLYGPEAIGGAINIITKKGGDKAIGGEVSTTLDSSTDGYALNGSVNGKVDGFSYRVSGQYSKDDDRETATETLDGTQAKMRNVSTYLGYDLGNLSVSATYEDYDSYIDGHSDPSMVTDLNKWSRRKGSLVADYIDVSHYIPKIHLDSYVQQSFKDFTNDFNPAPVMSYTGQTKNTQMTYGVNAQADITPSENHYVIAGYSYTQEDLDADDYKKFVMMFTPTITNYNYKASQTTHAVFMQDEWTLPADFTLTTGMRYTWAKSEMQSTNDPGYSGDSSTSDSHPVFSSALVWNGIENLTLRGLFSQGYRFPSLTNTIMPSGMMGITILPNKDLSPEKSNNYEIGARYYGNGISLDATAFYSKAKDYITAVDITSSTQKYQNLQGADTVGFEMYAGYTFEDYDLTPYVNTTVMRRQFDYGTTSTWNSGTPLLRGKYGVKYEHDYASLPVAETPGTLWFDLYSRASMGVKTESANGTVESEGGWGTLNLGFGSEFGKDHQYTASFNVNNIFDHQYTPALDTYEAPGINLVFTLGAKF